MPKYIRSNIDWFKSHATFVEGRWKCKETLAVIMVQSVDRSVHEGLHDIAGSGRVTTVSHLFCPKCEPTWTPPVQGSPIEERELVTVD